MKRDGHRSAPVRKFFRRLHEHGPLGAVKGVTAFALERFGEHRATRALDRSVHALQAYLSKGFDQKHGTKTGGYIPLSELEIESATEECNWYEPMSIKVFDAMMDQLNIDPSEYVFVDYGSGMGLVLLLASRRGFKEIVGVEFSERLHRIAESNIARFERQTGKPGRAASLHMNALDYELPDAPLVLFFYCPFTGTVMQQVVDRIKHTHARYGRRIVLCFYGQHPGNLAILDAMGFASRELRVPRDWTHMYRYRALIYCSPKATD